MSHFEAGLFIYFFDAGRVLHRKSQIISVFRSYPNSSLDTLSTSLRTKAALLKNAYSQAARERF